MTQSNPISLIFDKHLPSFTHISPITRKDKALLVNTVRKFRPDSKNYEDSWGYVIQATRYGGFKWYDKKTGSLIFFCRKSDSDNTLVVPSFFAEPKYLSLVIETMQSKLKCTQTILKNINDEDIGQLVKYSFRRYKENEAWNSTARFDDQTYPQSIVDLKEITDLKGKKYHHLRKTLRKDPKAIIRKYREADQDGVLKIFAIRDGNLQDTSERLKGMFYESHAMYPSADMNKFVVTDKNTNDILGFTATSEITADTSAFVALIFKPEIKIASVWGIYQTMVYCYKKGIKTINFGGSESEGTDTFVKRNFQPKEQIKKTHLVYDP